MHYTGLIDYEEMPRINALWDILIQASFFCEIQKEIERIGATIPFQRQLRLDPIGLVDRYNGTFTQNYNLTMSQYYLGFGYRF